MSGRDPSQGRMSAAFCISAPGWDWVGAHQSQYLSRKVGRATWGSTSPPSSMAFSAADSLAVPGEGGSFAIRLSHFPNSVVNLFQFGK